MAPLRHRSIIVIDDEDAVAVDEDLIIHDHGMIHLPISLCCHLFDQNPLSSHHIELAAPVSRRIQSGSDFRHWGLRFIIYSTC